MGLFSGSCGVLAGYPVPAGTGQDGPPSAPEQQSAGRTPHPLKTDHHAGTGRHPPQHSGGDGGRRGAAGNDTITATATMALSIGIAIQNFPEGAIISMPLQAEGVGKGRAFLYGVLSGIVEPLAAVLTMLAAGLILPALPYLLGFAAGAMIYVVVEQLIPEASAGEHSNLGTMFFAAGFTIMLALDVALG